MQLDLHGVRHYEVDRLVENFIYLNQDAVPLTIICGNSGRMLDLVKQVTNRIGCEIFEPRFGVVYIQKV
jgi:hypothetical protein